MRQAIEEGFEGEIELEQTPGVYEPAAMMGAAFVKWYEGEDDERQTPAI